MPLMVAVSFEQACVPVGQSEVRALETEVYRAVDVKVPKLTTLLPSSTVAALFWGVQPARMVQVSPLAAYGVQT